MRISDPFGNIKPSAFGEKYGQTNPYFSSYVSSVKTISLR
jgi:hypothetical protein